MPVSANSAAGSGSPGMGIKRPFGAIWKERSKPPMKSAPKKRRSSGAGNACVGDEPKSTKTTDCGIGISWPLGFTRKDA